MYASRSLDAAVGVPLTSTSSYAGLLRAVGQLPGHEPEELVLDLVGDRVADEREVGLVGVEHVLDQRVIGLSQYRPCSM